MPWCPKCKSEYVEGITECADCKVPLVEELVEEKKEDMEQLKIENAPVIEVADDGKEDIEKPSFTQPYENYHDKAANFKSSAYTLVFVGIIGLIALVLLHFDVLPIHFYGGGKYLTDIVMGGMFLIFIIVGIKSFNSATKYQELAIQEDNLTEEIKKWIAENIDAESIIRTEKEKNPDMGEEMKYFFYYGSLKQKVSDAFPDAKESYLDNLLEDVYTQLFDENSDAE